jgi:hypothetical protein
MKPVQPTLTIQLDDATYEVAKMSEQVQQLVGFFDDWRQKEADLSSDLLMVRSALRDAQTALVQMLKQEREEAMQKAQNLGLLPAANDGAEGAAE